jgi:hypothetical protein
MSTSVTYTRMPSVEKWMKDSSVMFAVRKKDIILVRIDELLTLFHTLKAGEPNVNALRIVVLADLFLTTNFWIARHHKTDAIWKGGVKGTINTQMERDRYPAILGLFGIVVDVLKKLFGVTRDVDVSNRMKEYFGRHMSSHGVTCDLDDEMAKYFTVKERALFRLCFKGGLAYQYRWWANPVTLELQRAYSIFSYTPVNRRVVAGGASNMGTPNYGGFIMTLDREIYMTKHLFDPRGRGQNAGIFHSSYTQGDLVACAGTMLIEGGIIKAVRTDSGHYRTTEQNVVGLMMALRMYSVDIGRIYIFDYLNQPMGWGDELLRKGSWDKFVAHAANERTNQATAKRTIQNLEPDAAKKMHTRQELQAKLTKVYNMERSVA